MRPDIDTAYVALDPAKPELEWVNSFARLGPDFHTELDPRPLPSPYWVGRSRALARELGLQDQWLESAEALEVFARQAPVSEELRECGCVVAVEHAEGEEVGDVRGDGAP